MQMEHGMCTIGENGVSDGAMSNSLLVLENEDEGLVPMVTDNRYPAGCRIGEKHCLREKWTCRQKSIIAEGRRLGELNKSRIGLNFQGHPMYLFSCCARRR